jgi:hypothetical protein
MLKQYKFGHLNFKVSGDDLVIRSLVEELASIEVSPDGEELISFHFSEDNKTIPGGVYVSPVVASNSAFAYKGDGFSYKVEKKGVKLEMLIESNKLNWKAANFPQLSRVRDWNFLLPSEQIAKNFMYNIFDYVTQILNVQVNQSYFHASSFEKDGRGVAIVAWGGIGKTTAMLKLVSEDNWKFLSDDLGLIDSEGIIYRSPKKLQIYAYNLVNQPVLKNLLLTGRGLLDRMNWHYKLKKNGIKGARRRDSAERLFTSELIGTKAKLTDVFFIERADVPQFSSTPLNIPELARRASATVMSEIEPFHRITSAIHSIQENAIIPNYNTMYAATNDILLKAFARTQPKLIKIPLQAGPDELANYLRKQLQ